jgi:hypothetical protein
MFGENCEILMQGQLVNPIQVLVHNDEVDSRHTMGIGGVVGEVEIECDRITVHDHRCTN